MSNLNQSSILATASFSGFRGVDTRHTHSGEPSTAELTNFRIRTDGSLEKRYGFRHLLTLPSDIRAFWRGRLDGEILAFALCGNTIYRPNSDFTEYETVGTVQTSSGGADFFFYRGRLYLIDGQKLYRITEHTVTSVSGYVPHYAKNRNCNEEGEVYEALNHLNRNARLTFLIGDPPSSYLHINEVPSAISEVYLNGELLSEDQYGYSSLLRAVGVKDLVPGDRVLLCIRYAKASAELGNLLSCTSATVFGGISNSRVFLWNGTEKNTLFASAFVSRDELTESQSYYPASDALYFPEHYEFSVGDGQYAVRAVQRHFDRLLIFTEEDVWMADTSSSGLDDFPTMNINSSAACAVLKGAATLGNEPVSVGRHTLFRWTTETDERNECNAYSLSVPIDSELPDSFFANAVLFTDPERDELWFHGGDEDGTVWIYSVEKSAWFRFTGICADRFFPFDREVAFIKGDQIFCFDPSLRVDVLADGEERPIVARFRSGILSFGTHEKKKMTLLSLCGEATSEPPTVRLCADGIGDVVFPLNLHEESAISRDRHVSARKRLHTGRFRYATVELTSEGTEPLVIHELSLWAQSYHMKGNM